MEDEASSTPAAPSHGILHHPQPQHPSGNGSVTTPHSPHSERRVNITEPNTPPPYAAEERHPDHTVEGHDNEAFEADLPSTPQPNGTSMHSQLPFQQAKAATTLQQKLAHLQHRAAATGRMGRNHHPTENGSTTESVRGGSGGGAGIGLDSSESTKASKDPRWWVRLRVWPPSSEQLARFAALVFVGLLVWAIIYVLIGEDASPLGGQLFSLAALCIAAKVGGWLATRVRLPALLGMLLVGIAAKNTGLVSISPHYVEFVSNIRRVALVIILIRAGLDLDPKATKKLFGTILKLALGPWSIECCMIAVTTNIFLGLPWGWAFMLGAIEAAVSPAVVVPGLLRLRLKGFGVAKGIPTLILAVTGIDDAFSVAAFGVISSIMLTTGSLIYSIALGPASVLMGVAFGILWGNLTRFVPNKEDPFAAHLRVLLLFLGGLVAVLGSDEIGFGGAGPLGVIIASYVSGCIWTAEGWEVEENPVAIAFEVFWLIFEPILFGITGTQIDFNVYDSHAMWLAVGCIIIAAIIRIIATVLLAIGCKLNLKEKIFVSFSWMAKATVQAALGPVSMDLVRNSGKPEEQEYARTVLMVCVLSILLTAPIGAVTIALSGPRLLKRTTPPLTDNWRRHARPSLRDISIYDENDMDDSRDEEEESAQPPKDLTDTHTHL